MRRPAAAVLAAVLAAGIVVTGASAASGRHASVTSRPAARTATVTTTVTATATVTAPGPTVTVTEPGPTVTVTDPGTPTATATPTPTPTPTPTTATGGNCTDPIFSSSDPNATIRIDPAGLWWVNNDAWSGSHGPQTIEVCSQSSWNATSNQPDVGGQVETYPDTEYDIGARSTTGTESPATKTIDQYQSISSTYAEEFPDAGSWDAAYDMWLNNWGIEVMVWNEDHGSATYWNDKGVPVTLGGVDYHYIKQGATFFVFIRDMQNKAGTVDLLAPMKYLVAQGEVRGTAIPTQLEYGVEICSTVGTQTFPLTDLSFTLT